MKIIGLIGGMSWKSSLEYYRIINEVIQNKLGGWHSAKIVMYSVDFDEMDLEHQTKDWANSDKILIDAAKTLEKVGADFIVICCNTAHVLYEEIQKNVKIPILHIADATADKIKAQKIKKVGLLGTRFTMNEDFYKGRLEEKHRLTVIVPTEKEKETVHTGINSIIKGETNPSIRKSLKVATLGCSEILRISDMKKQFIEIINNLSENGAEAVILGCTEIPLIVSQKDVKVVLFDTARIHAESAAEYSMKKG